MTKRVLTPEQYEAHQARHAKRDQSLRAAPIAIAPVAPTKYRAVKTDGYASKKEAKRAAELRLLEAAHKIVDLREQVRFEIIPKQDGERACKYVADFVYRDFDGNTVVEDTKGFRTPTYAIKRKLMLLVHGIRIKEV